MNWTNTKRSCVRGCTHPGCVFYSYWNKWDALYVIRICMWELSPNVMLSDGVWREQFLIEGRNGSLR